MTRIEDFLGSAGTLTVADLSNRKTHEANHNCVEAAQILKQFRAERLRLLERVQGIDASLLARTLVHPRLKQPMRLVDHLYFVAEHDDHHLATIWHQLQ